MGDCSVNGRTAVVTYLTPIFFTGPAAFFAEALFEATLEVSDFGAAF